MENTMKNDLKIQLINHLHKLKDSAKGKTIDLQKNESRLIPEFVERSFLETDQYMMTMISDREIFAMRNIEEALAKIDRDLFGICEECGHEIHKERLDGFPSCRLCISCQEKREKIGKRHRYFTTYPDRLSLS